MSGIVGLLHLDGSPVEQTLLHKLTMFMSQRGPDAQNTWRKNNVGLGHTLLITTNEARYEQQPTAYDNRLWITADARIDGRSQLLRRLGLKQSQLASLTDPELILLAYCKWGEACVEYLIGDFAFAIWDEPRQTLFCARDHFGIKPFYYAYNSNRYFVFSNTLNCLHLHPSISDKLNDLAIADFLIFGRNQDLATTTFADISRLPPAHFLTCCEGNLHIQRYWDLPVKERPVRYKRKEDYVENFLAHWQEAVSDRLRLRKVGLFMSGGLDSTSVAAMAHQELSSQTEPFELQTVTLAAGSVDKESPYARLVADTLAIPHKLIWLDQTILPYDKIQLQGCTPAPEPLGQKLGQKREKELDELFSRFRVILNGHGGDAILYPSQTYLIYLLKGLKFNHLVRDIGLFWLSRKQLPPLYIRSNLRKWLKPSTLSYFSPYPSWLNKDMEQRLELHARWNSFRLPAAPYHPTRNESYVSLGYTIWPTLFEQSNPGVTGRQFETRYPFFDTRLVDYLLSIPAVPWCVDKEILRLSMKQYLPEVIRQRQKTPLGNHPLPSTTLEALPSWADYVTNAAVVYPYVDRRQIVELISSNPPHKWNLTRVFKLAYWLQYW